MLTKTILTTVLASMAMASPVRRAAPKSMKSADAEWTLEKLTQTCNEDDTKCTWNFGINANNGDDVADCEYIIEGSPASQTPGVEPQECGVYTITSGYSANEDPFTSISVVNYDTGKMIFTGYNDRWLENGEPVDPDRAWPVVDIP
jgi:hypothetical protein